MPHAVFVKVRIAPDRADESVKALHENVVPMVKGAPGFVTGTWFGDAQDGHSVIVFETQEQAQQMASMVTSNAEDPVQIESATVYEVHAQA